MSILESIDDLIEEAKNFTKIPILAHIPKIFGKGIPLRGRIKHADAFLQRIGKRLIRGSAGGGINYNDPKYVDYKFGEKYALKNTPSTEHQIKQDILDRRITRNKIQQRLIGREEKLKRAKEVNNPNAGQRQDIENYEKSVAQTKDELEKYKMETLPSAAPGDAEIKRARLNRRLAGTGYLAAIGIAAGSGVASVPYIASKLTNSSDDQKK